MKVAVYAKRFDPQYTDTLVWQGDMECIPRVGEMIFFFEGWGGLKVERVYWNLDFNSVEISFDDRTGEYSRHALQLRRKGKTNGKVTPS